VPGRVVVVEDDEDIRELLHLVLESEGFEVVALNHPLSLETLDSHRPPALFLLDLMLPGMSGVEAARQLRGRGFTAPFIAISASRLKLQVAAGSGLFDGTVCKPFDLHDLIECLHRTMVATTGSAGGLSGPYCSTGDSRDW